MISDGHTYAAIITALGEDGRGFNEVNLSNWKEGGYKDWLAEQKDYEEAGLWEEYTLDLVKQNDISSLNEATIKMATIQIRKALRAIGQASFETNMQDNPEIYIRLLNALSRLTTGAMSCQANRLKEEQRQQATQLKQGDPDSLCITAETLAKIEKLLRLR